MFRFLNRRGEPYEWTDEVPEDDPDFQGLLDENDGTAAYPDVSAELPGVELESEDFQTITDEPEPDFRDLAGAALHNAGINADEMIRIAQGEHACEPSTGPALGAADEDEIVYELTFDLPDAGLHDNDAEHVSDMGDSQRDDTSTVVMGADDETASQRYPT